jgi:hypothetical protein
MNVGYRNPIIGATAPMRDSEPRYIVTVERQPGLVNFLCGLRYVVSVYTDEPPRGFKGVEHAGTLKGASRVGRELVREAESLRQIKEWRTNIDFEVRP